MYSSLIQLFAQACFVFADLEMEYSLVRTEGNQVTCLFCTKIFSRMSNARRHFREAHNAVNRSRSFKCTLCNQAAFGVKRYLIEHLLKKHHVTPSRLPEEAEEVDIL